MFVLIACQIGRGDDLDGEREQMGVNDNDKRVSFVIQVKKFTWKLARATSSLYANLRITFRGSHYMYLKTTLNELLRTFQFSNSSKHLRFARLSDSVHRVPVGLPFPTNAT